MKNSGQIQMIWFKFWFAFGFLTLWVVVLFELLRSTFLILFVWPRSWQRRFSQKLGTRKVYIYHAENSSEVVHDILETYLPDANFDKFIRLRIVTGKKHSQIKLKHLQKYELGTASKVAIFRVFLVRIFPHLDWIRCYLLRKSLYSVRMPGKKTRKTPNTLTFCAV